MTEFIADGIDELADIVFGLVDGDASALELAFRNAEGGGVDPETIREALLQQVPFSGFPAVIEAFGAWKPTDGGAVDREGQASNEDSGREVFEAVYGSVSDRVLAALRSNAPELERWILDFAYGRVMARRFLSLGKVEVLGAIALLAQGRATPLKSHVRGALRVGVPKNTLRDVLMRFDGRADPDVLVAAIEQLER